MGFVVEAVIDALASLLVPRSSWGFIIRAAILVGLVLVALEFA